MNTSECDWQELRVERAERGRRALCDLHCLVYPQDIHICYTANDKYDSDFVEYAEDFQPWRQEDFVVDPAYAYMHDPSIAPPTADYSERDSWIVHYDAMQPCFAQLTEHGPDAWKMHANKHGNQPWWEPRWATLAYGQTQWTGCDEGLCERVSMRCRSCYTMREHADSTGAKEYIWCKDCPCGCTSLETCYEFPDHCESRQLHIPLMQHVLNAIQDYPANLCDAI